MEESTDGVKLQSLYKDKPLFKRVVYAILTPVGFVALLPFFLLWKTKLFRYRSFSIPLAIIPTNVGVLLRRIWYQNTLKKCGHNLHVEWMAYIRTEKTEVGNDVMIGSFAYVGLATLEDCVGIGPYAIVLSGRYHHLAGHPNTPTIHTPGKDVRIHFGKGSWCAAGTIVAADVGEGSIIGAGTTVVKPVGSREVVVGAPVRVVKTLDKKEYDQ